MPITVNGQTVDNLNEAFDLCRAAWSEQKKDAVAEQKAEALSKPSMIDIERAAAGIAPDVVTGRINAMSGGATGALERLNNERARAGREAAEAAANTAEVTPPVQPENQPNP